MYQPEKLKLKRTEHGFSQLSIAERIGVSKQAYSKWEKGISQPTNENLMKLENLFKVPSGYFNEEEILNLYHQLNSPNQSKAITYVRGLVSSQSKVSNSIQEILYEYKVFEKMSAGIGSSIYDDGEYDTVYFNEELAHDFASWIDGDSMEPTYHNHDVALIRESGFDYDGAIYAVVWNDQTYIKKVYRDEDGLRLVSINKDYADKFAPYDENPRIVGKIVGSFTPMEA